MQADDGIDLPSASIPEIAGILEGFALAISHENEDELQALSGSGDKAQQIIAEREAKTGSPATRRP